MKHLMKLSAAALVTGSLGLAACGGSDETATADDKAADAPVTVTGAWARVTASGQKTGAIYLTIRSTQADRLTSASVPASVAGKAELHETTGGAGAGAGAMHGSDHGDAMATKMKAMKHVSHIAVPEGGSVALKPGGYHVMLFDLAGPIRAGTRIPVTLSFDQAGTVDVTAVAREG